MQSRDDVELIDQLKDELTTLAKRRLECASEYLSELQKLGEVASELFPDMWSTDPVAALTALLKDVIDRLDNAKFMRDTTMTWREFASGIYNIAGADLSHVDGNRYSYLVSETFRLADLAGMPPDSRRNYTNRLRGRLAYRIYELYKNSLSQTDELVDLSPLERFFRLAYRCHPMIIILGSEISCGPSIPQHSRLRAEVHECIREIVQYAPTTLVLSYMEDLSIWLGDISPDRALLRRFSDSDSTAVKSVKQRVIEYFGLLDTQQSPSPLLAGLDLSEAERREISQMLQVCQRTEQVQFVEVHVEDNDDMSSWEFLQNLRDLVRRTQLAYQCTQVDFEKDVSISSLIEGDPVSPGICRVGFWPDSLLQAAQRPRSSRGYDDIVGGSGTGKTAFAYLRAYSLAPRSTFYLNVSATTSPSSSDFRSLIAWLEDCHPRSVLIVDNLPEISSELKSIYEMLRSRNSHTYLVSVRTTELLIQAHGNAEILGTGEYRFNEDIVWVWQEVQGSLGQWLFDSKDIEAPQWEIRTALSSATCLWHLFYILRGGANTLDREIAESATHDLADVVWFAVAAMTVFRAQPVRFKEIYKFIDEFDLWPLTNSKSSNGKWLEGAFHYLVANRRLVIAAANVFECRHRLEAKGLVRLSCDRDPQLIMHTYLAVVERLFCQEVHRIHVSDVLIEGSKEAIKLNVQDFVRYELEPTMRRQKELEQVVVWTSILQRHVDSVWQEVVDAIEHWPIHPLYTLFNRSHLSDILFRINPFRQLRSLATIEAIRSESDAIDVWYIIKGLVGYDALQDAQAWWRRRDVEDDINWIAGILENDGAPDDVRSSFEEMASSLRERMQRNEVRPRGMKSIEESVLIDWEAGRLDRNRAVPVIGYRFAAVRAWLDEMSSRFESATSQIDISRLVTGLSTCSRSAQAITIMHLWLISPNLGLKAFDSVPEDAKQELVSKLTASEGNRYLELHITPDDFSLVLFANALLDRRSELATWLESEDSGYFGGTARLARTIALTSPDTDKVS